MSLDLSALDNIPEAIRHFWKARDLAAQRQKKRGAADQGGRAGVTAGKNLDGFIATARQLVIDNGIPDAHVWEQLQQPC